MDPKIMEIGGELQKVLGEYWEGLCITAGINAGFFDMLTDETPVSIEVAAKKYGYDPDKVEKWFYFAELYNFIKKVEGGYLLDERGKFFTQHSPMKDFLGMFLSTDYLMRAVIEAKVTFKKNKSLDTLSESKISRDYHLKVSDNLSATLFNYFKEAKIGANDTLLDFGCGNGSFLRTLSKHFPDVKLCGVDSNMFAIEMGKKENNQLGLSDRINLIIDDVTANMEGFETGSYDWVTAINILYYIPPEKRLNVINNMIRIACKGVFITESIIETSLISASANVLVNLLWNDYTGAFKKKDVDEFNQYIKDKYSKYNFRIEPIMQGTSILVIIIKG